MAKRSLAAMALVAALAMAGTLAGQAQAPTPAPGAAPTARPTGSRSATTSGVSTERLARIDAMLQSYVDRGLLPGVVALVLRDGHPVYQKAVGWADKEANRPMKMDTLFRIASQTKAITSVAALTLVEEGKLGLSDPVSTYIPSFAKTMVAMREGTATTIVPAKRPITIRDLLTHTAGISYGVEPHIANDYAAKGLGPSAGAGW
jgi:CubicO group peptidase (beta-lactamase class C family)